MNASLAGSCWPALRRDVLTAVSGGVAYLIDHQCDDGFWREYDLAPGQSEAWTTSWVGSAILATAASSDHRTSLARAARAVAGAAADGGWGYNRASRPDADSTAWALAFLSAMGVGLGRAGLCCMRAYLDAGGSAHTFLDDDAGGWGEAHPDVTPIAGLALLGLGAPACLVDLVRAAVLGSPRPDGIWTSYWWSTDTYATAWSLRFLARSGGVPASCASSGERWLARLEEGGTSPFESAHRLLAATALGLHAADLAVDLVDEVLRGASAGGAWPPSAALMVPSRRNEPGSGPHADTRGIMTTAISSAALCAWMRAADAVRV